ncbi:aminoimidazole riboside kinase [Rouxiella sp. S1S-2]|uniref:aminoimidazole riboside kinase n=1 Tax=Rouxiella sp. S1S-2 TaxID=2653856 RepID=UPI00126467D6|nr:aminoimidazole riboside kinase [Rouxiella sp. S1S-2]KAB7897143.1 aminoimidazole riboside kinase [Rouxiella sp. S1S-2]
MKNRVWVLGDAVVDLITQGDDSFLKCPGGAPANVAVGVRRLGGDSAFIGRVGDDPFGKFLHNTLLDEGVDVTYMLKDALHRTSTVVVENTDDGERSFTFMVRPSADLFLQSGDIPTFEKGQLLHLCSISLSAEPSRSAAILAMQRMRAAGGIVCFDPNIRLDLWASETDLRECLHQALLLADVVKVSEDELSFLTAEPQTAAAVDIMVQRYRPKLLLVTQGKAGVMVYAQRKSLIEHYPAPTIKVVDTTGAGDAFVAGLLAGLAQSGLDASEQQWSATLAQAIACGALATTAKGAMTALPKRAQLKAFLSVEAG